MLSLKKLWTKFMGEECAVVLSDWPQPAAGAPVPRVFADDCLLSLRYWTADERFAVIKFPLCTYFVFGQPNDEALNGHPLYKRGLTFYSVHQVQHSSLIQTLEQRNAVHPHHNRKQWLQDKKHYIFTFQDSTLECVVNEGEWWKPKIAIFDNEGEAIQCWLKPDDRS